MHLYVYGRGNYDISSTDDSTSASHVDLAGTSLDGDAYFTDSFTPVPLSPFHVPGKANTTLREQI